MLKKIADGVEKVQIVVGACFISLFLVCVLIQIATRYLNIVATWSEDFTKYAFIWAVFMGASAMVHEKQHFAFTSLTDALTGKKLIAMQTVISILMLIFTVSLAYYGVSVTKSFWNYQWVTVPSFKMGWVWLSLPVAGFTMSFYLVLHIIDYVAQLMKGGDSK